MRETAPHELLEITFGTERFFPQPKTHHDSFKAFKTTKEQMAEMRAHLESLIDAMAKNASLFTRIATFWGELPAWQRATTGITVFGGLLIVGIILQAGLICSSIALLALCTGLILDDHYAANKQSIENLKKGILSLSSLLETVISALDAIREQLAVEIDRFCAENHQLKESVAAFQQEMNELTQEVDRLSRTETLLRETERKLSQVQVDFEESNQAHQRKIADLTTLNLKLELEIDKLQKLGSILSASTELLSATILTNDVDRTDFQRKLDDFMTDKTKLFDQSAENFLSAKQEFVQAQAQLQESNRQYAALIAQHKHEMMRLKKLPAEPTNAHPSAIGMFSNTTLKPSPFAELTPAPTAISSVA